MTLYEIDAAMTALVDAETGELKDYEAFDALQMERESKIENMALWMKDLAAEENALKAEIDNLTARKRAAGAKRERLGEYLQEYLSGEKYKSSRVAISYRRSSAVEVLDEDMLRANCPMEYLRMKEPEINKAAILKGLKAGEEIPGAVLVERTSMTVK